jgi:integrase
VQKTINRYLSSYRTHWKWLMQRDRIASNPWLETHISERSRLGGDHDDQGNGQGKRSFTDREVRTLLAGSAPEPLPDLMMIAALTGARINAICELRVKDCWGGAFLFRRAKQEPRDRTIPIHSRLKSIVARRSAKKRPNDFLFVELPDATATRPRSAAASQSFTRYRREVGVEERSDGRRQSNVDFHSFRRWFTTKAEQAGQRPHIIDFVTGHKRPGETLGRYSEGPSMVQLRACVEAVKLPRLPAKPRPRADHYHGHHEGQRPSRPSTVIRLTMSRIGGVG